MAVYTENFAGHTVDAPPAGWTERWNVDNADWYVRADAEAEGGKLLRGTATVDARRLLSWDAIDADANRADVDIVTRFRYGNDAYSDNDVFRIHARASGVAGAESAYFVTARGYSDALQLSKYVNGVSTNIGAAYSHTLDANTWYYLRFRVNGTALKVRVWRADEIEPAAWSIEATDTSLASAGWVGVGYFDYGGAKDIDYVAVATAGETAPLTQTSVEERLTQTVIEVAFATDPDARLTQEVIEVAFATNPDARLSQMAIEMLVPNAPPGGNYVIVNVIT